MASKVIVSGTGCCLVDLMYNNIDFTGEAIRPFFSKIPGDGGLTPGKLVFREEFEKFSGVRLEQFISAITGGRNYDKINVGGPSIVSLIHAAQLTGKEKCEVRFYGKAGSDAHGDYLINSIRKTPVVLKDYALTKKPTPSTLVLSDPGYNNGHGERMFINSIGAAWDYHPEDLKDDFFSSDIVVFGGTALVPHIHDKLATLLKRARSKRCITIVNTVFDFRNEKANPSGKWPVGESDESYSLTDLLITDREEALRLSGQADPGKALKFFQDKGVRSAVITNGSEPILVFSDGSFFRQSGIINMQISDLIRKELKKPHNGDTTGCGDNFAGGMIASIVSQLEIGNKHPDIIDACSWGIVSGGYTCFYMGGTFFEEKPGEKMERIRPYFDSYTQQLSGENIF